MLRLLPLAILLTALGAGSAWPGIIRHVLILGNSISRHGPAPSIGWNGDWGMAASAEDRDYVHRCLAGIQGLQGIEPTSSVNGIADFERGFYRIDSGIFLAPFDSVEADLIIVQAGDNVSRDTALAEDLQGHYFGLLAELGRRHPGVPILATTRFWSDPVIDSMIITSVRLANAKLIDLRPLSLDTLNQARTERSFTNSGVAIHPGDLGMQHIAERILAVLYPEAVDESQVAPSTFRLDQNYPNPFNPSTRVRFSLSNSGTVSLEVLDVLGRPVRTLNEGTLSSGPHEGTFDGTGLASGAYYLRLTQRGSSLVRTMMLVR